MKQKDTGNEIIPLETITTNITNQLTVNQEVTNKNIEELTDKYQNMIIFSTSDKTGYKSTDTARKHVKALRCEVQKKSKELQDYPKSLTKAIKEEERRIVDLLLPTENYLIGQLSNIDEKKKEEAEQIRLENEKIFNTRMAIIAQYDCMQDHDEILQYGERIAVLDGLIQQTEEEFSVYCEALRNTQLEHDRIECLKIDRFEALEKLGVTRQKNYLFLGNDPLGFFDDLSIDESFTEKKKAAIQYDKERKAEALTLKYMERRIEITDLGAQVSDTEFRVPGTEIYISKAESVLGGLPDADYDVFVTALRNYKLDKETRERKAAQDKLAEEKVIERTFVGNTKITVTETPKTTHEIPDWMPEKELITEPPEDLPFPTDEVMVDYAEPGTESKTVHQTVSPDESLEGKWPPPKKEIKTQKCTKFAFMVEVHDNGNIFQENRLIGHLNDNIHFDDLDKAF